MPVFSRTEALGQPLTSPHTARWWTRTETLGAGNVVEYTSIVDNGTIQGYLHRQVSQAMLDTHGLMAHQAAEFQMPVRYGRVVDGVQPVKISDELQIGGQRWQVITRPIIQDVHQMGGHAQVLLKTAEAE